MTVADQSNKPVSLTQISAIGVRVAGAGLGFLATLYATNLLGADLAGVFFASVAWAGFLAIVARWGMQDVMMLSLPALQKRATAEQMAGRIASFFRMLIARLLILSMICVLVWIVLGYLDLDLQMSVPTIAALAVVTALLQLLSTLTKARGKPVLAFAGELAIPPMLVLIALFVSSKSASETGVVETTVAYATSALAGAVLLAFVSRRQFAKSGTPKKVPRKLASRAGTFATIELALFLTAFSSVMLMPFLLGAAETGAFNLALRIVAVATLVPSTVAAVITPALVRASGAQTSNRRELVRQGRWVMALCAVVYALGVGLIGPHVLQWAGDEFVSAQTAMYYMMAGFAGGLLLGPTGVLLAIDGREKVARAVAVWAAILTLAALVVATPIFGLEGAAAVVGASFFLQRLVLFLAEQRKPKAA